MFISCDLHSLSLPSTFDFDSSSQTVVTIGTFDGVHIGHKTLLTHTSEYAKKIQAKSIAIAFEPHPQKILLGKTPMPLTTPEQKACLLQETGVDLVIQLEFTQELANMSTEEFIQKILIHKLRMKGLVLGHDFAMGKDRKGTKEIIKELSTKLIFNLEYLDPVSASDGAPISSSTIRTAICNGHIEEARTLLGRPYTIQGVVSHGKKRGRQLGFPTANIADIPVILPKKGVYVTLVTIPPAYISPNNTKITPQTHSFLSITNIGTRPTFSEKIPVVETHLLDFKKDIYSQKISIDFLKYLRDEKIFKDISLLVKEIQRDLLQAKEFFTK